MRSSIEPQKAYVGIIQFMLRNRRYTFFVCRRFCNEEQNVVFVDQADFIAFINFDAMIDMQYQRYLPYFKQVGYIK